jgi:hypothetical protein
MRKAEDDESATISKSVNNKVDVSKVLIRHSK